MEFKIPELRHLTQFRDSFQTERVGFEPTVRRRITSFQD